MPQIIDVSLFTSSLSDCFFSFAIFHNLNLFFRQSIQLIHQHINLSVGCVDLALKDVWSLGVFAWANCLWRDNINEFSYSVGSLNGLYLIQ